MSVVKRKAVAYSGNGSAIANYLKPEPEQEKKPENWAAFSKTKPDPVKRSVLFSQLHTYGWTVPHAKYGRVPDLERLSKFLQSANSPVKKKLKDMDGTEMEKLIACFKNMIIKKFK